MTVYEQIERKLRFASGWLAVHEFDIPGYSENNLATRISEMAREGEVVGRIRKGAHYKEWSLVKAEKSGQVLMEIQ